MGIWLKEHRSHFSRVLLMLCCVATTGCLSASGNRAVMVHPGAMEVVGAATIASHVEGPFASTEREPAAHLQAGPAQAAPTQTDPAGPQERAARSLRKQSPSRLLRVRNEPPRNLDDLEAAVRAAHETVQQSAELTSPRSRTDLGSGVSVWVEMVRPAEEIVRETMLEQHELVNDPTLWSLSWVLDLDPRTAVFLSVAASRQLDEAVTDSMLDPDYAWFGLGVVFRF